MKRILLPVVGWIAAVPSASAAEPIRPKVVVVAMFESGADTGGRPGEFQLWVEREKLTQVLPFPQGYRDLRPNADGSVLGVVTGVATAKSAATIMALGLDPAVRPFEGLQSLTFLARAKRVDVRRVPVLRTAGILTCNGRAATRPRVSAARNSGRVTRPICRRWRRATGWEAR